MYFAWPFIGSVFLCFYAMAYVILLRRERETDRQEIARLQRLIVKLSNEPPARPATPEGD